MLDFSATQEVNGYALDNQCYVANRAKLKSLAASNWSLATQAAAPQILVTLRTASLQDATADIAARIEKRNASPRSIWDAIHLAAAELAMRCHSGNTIVGIHAVSSANALRYAYETAATPETRLLLTLQAAGWMVQFRTFAESRPNGIRSFPILDLQPAAEPGLPVQPIFADFKQQKDDAAARILALAKMSNHRREILATAMQQAVLKIDEVHYFKYLAALIEDSRLVSEPYQPYLIAAIPYYGKSAADAVSPPMRRASEAIRSLPDALNVKIA